MVVEPTEEMLIAARDWSHKKYGIPIGDDAATGCWKAMAAVLPAQDDWVQIAKALFQIERDPTIKDQAWFDFQGKAQRLIALMQNQ